MFITGRRKEMLDEAVAAIGRNVTAVQADSGDLKTQGLTAQIALSR